MPEHKMSLQGMVHDDEKLPAPRRFGYLLIIFVIVAAVVSFFIMAAPTCHNQCATSRHTKACEVLCEMEQ